MKVFVRTDGTGCVRLNFLPGLSDGLVGPATNKEIEKKNERTKEIEGHFLSGSFATVLDRPSVVPVPATRYARVCCDGSDFLEDMPERIFASKILLACRLNG